MISTYMHILTHTFVRDLHTYTEHKYVCLCTYMVHKQQTSCSNTHGPSCVCSTLRDSSTQSHVHKAMLRSCRVCLGTLVIMTACDTPHRSTMLSHHTCTQASSQVACNNIPLTAARATWGPGTRPQAASSADCCRDSCAGTRGLRLASCVYVYVHLFMHACMHVCMFVSLHTYMDVCMHV